MKQPPPSSSTNGSSPLTPQDHHLILIERYLPLFCDMASFRKGFVLPASHCDRPTFSSLICPAALLLHALLVLSPYTCVCLPISLSILSLLPAKLSWMTDGRPSGLHHAAGVLRLHPYRFCAPVLLFPLLSTYGRLTVK